MAIPKLTWKKFCIKFFQYVKFGDEVVDDECGVFIVDCKQVLKPF